jgi:hypothetical protein
MHVCSKKYIYDSDHIPNQDEKVGENYFNQTKNRSIIYSDTILNNKEMNPR